MKTGLVLEGGGIRGIFSAGVIDVLMEEGITFDGGIGVSAGAAFGSNYKSGQNRRAIRYNLRFAKDPRYSSIRSLIATGDLFNAQFCYHDIPEKLDPFDWETFRKNPMEFYLVCTDAETGKPVYHLCDCEKEDEWEMLEWFRASGSMPMVSRVVEIGGKKLLDGGVSDSIPLKFMEDQGYDRNVVILTRPADYIKKPNTMMPVIRHAMRSYPAMVDGMEYRHVMYNSELAYIRKREAGGYAFVIRPARDLDVGRVEHDRTKIRAAYKEGRRMARRLLPDIRRFLAGAKAETATGTIRPSMIEEEPVNVSKVVKASMVEDPTLNMTEENTAQTAHTAQTEPAQKAPAAKTASESAQPETVQAENIRKTVQTEPAPETPTAKTAETEPTQDTPAAKAAQTDTAQGAAQPSSARVKKTTVLPDPPVEKERVQEVRSILIGEPDDEPTIFEKPFPGDRAPDLAETPAGTNETAAADEAVTAGEDAAVVSEVPATASEEADVVSEVPATASEEAAVVSEVPATASEETDIVSEVLSAVNEGITAVSEALTAAIEEVAADDSPAQTVSAVNRTAANRPKKKRQKKAWKPGQMTYLKQKNESEE
ncbi:MAG: hypothetical protein E7238_05785 [Sarcina sp.]|nr:hypothetical protein [Sarcina sp.]